MSKFLQICISCVVAGLLVFITHKLLQIERQMADPNEKLLEINNQIAALQMQVSALQKATLDDNVKQNALLSGVNLTLYNVTDVSSTVDALKKNIAHIQESIDPLESPSALSLIGSTRSSIRSDINSIQSDVRSIKSDVSLIRLYGR